MMLNIVLFGPPGAGKGTQSEKIIEKFKLSHLSTGDLFRKHLSEGTELGKLAQKYMDEGDLVPDEVVIKMVEIRIKNETDSPGFIFDGFPRTVNQAKALDTMLAGLGQSIAGMIILDVDDEELKKRIMLRGKSSGRSDDQDVEKVNNRIRVYKEETLPVAEYYQEQNKYYRVEGVGSVDEIFDNICSVIEDLQVKMIE
jgi:adenylate kinase